MRDERLRGGWGDGGKGFSSIGAWRSQESLRSRGGSCQDCMIGEGRRGVLSVGRVPVV